MFVVDIQKVKCSICGGHIKPLRDKKGKVVWQHGNNAQPINDGNCCDACEKDLMIPERLKY